MVLKCFYIRLMVNLHGIRFSYVFVRFFTFLPLLDKVCAFSSAFLCVHIRTNQTVTYWTKVFRKNFFVKGYKLYFEISLLSFIHKIFEQNFYLYITVYLVRIWTFKNADEKAHTLSRRGKNVKKRTKTYEKRILCKFTLILKLSYRAFCIIHKIAELHSNISLVQYQNPEFRRNARGSRKKKNWSVCERTRILLIMSQ